MAFTRFIAFAKKGNIFHLMEKYWKENGSKFLENTLTLDSENSILDSNETLKRNKEFNEAVFVTNTGDKYVVKGVLVASSVNNVNVLFASSDSAAYTTPITNNNNNNGLRWLWNNDDIGSALEIGHMFKKIQQAKKYPELEEHGFNGIGIRYNEWSAVDEWFYMMILAYFVKGIGYYKSITGKEGNQKYIYFIVTSMKKIK